MLPDHKTLNPFKKLWIIWSKTYPGDFSPFEQFCIVALGSIFILAMVTVIAFVLGLLSVWIAKNAPWIFIVLAVLIVITLIIKVINIDLSDKIR